MQTSRLNEFANSVKTNSQKQLSPLVSIVHEQLPEFTSLERLIKNRNGKMYLDFLQNRPGATIASPYSLRPKSGATVSMPLHWDEVKKGLIMKDFTIQNSIERIKSEGDLFKGTLQKGIDMAKAQDACANMGIYAFSSNMQSAFFQKKNAIPKSGFYSF